MSSITSGVSTGCGTGTSAIAAGTPLGTVARYYDPCAFSNPVAGVLGNLGRNTLRGPGFEDVDFSLVKDTSVRQLGEAGSVEFRAEVFNILNHPDFALPNRTALLPELWPARRLLLPPRAKSPAQSEPPGRFSLL